MRNYKSILCLLLSLVLIFSVVFPMGAAAVEEPGAGNSGSRGIRLEFVGEDGETLGIESVMIYDVPDGTYNANTTHLQKYLPEGYDFVATGDYGVVKDNNGEEYITIALREKVYEKTIWVNYVTEDGDYVLSTTMVVDVDTMYLHTSELDVPYGYEVCADGDVSIANGAITVEVRAKTYQRHLYVNYVTEDGKSVLTTELTVDENLQYLNTSMLTDVPYGYEIAYTGDVQIDFATNSITVVVREKTYARHLYVNYVSEDGKPVLTTEITVDENLKYLNTSVLTDVPYGYEIANTGDMPIKGNHIDVVVREKAYTKSIVVNYVDEEGNLVLTSDILMSNEATHVNTSLLKDVPYGYEIAVTGDVRIEDNTVTVVVREKAYTKSVLVNYVNEADNKCVLTSSIVVYMDSTSVNTALLTDVPTGYEIAVTGDMPIEGNHINVFVREKTYTKSVVVNYITEDGALVLTSDVVVLEEQTSVNTSVLTDVPYGYEIAVTGDMAIEGNHIDVVVRLTPYTKSVLVNYVTEDGNCVLTSDIVMDKDATSVNTSLLKDVPYGYAIAITGDMPIENGQVFVTVRSTYVPEPTVPEETKPEETKPEETKPVETKPEESKPVETKPAATEGKTPNTGDASHAMTWVLLLTVSAVCAACAFFYLKKGNANR